MVRHATQFMYIYRYWSPAPLLYVFVPYSLGAWHFVLVGVFQHASLAQDVLDHRLNTRSCYINPISGFICEDLDASQFIRNLHLLLPLSESLTPS